ncbi:MAG: beta-ketoacyl-[acyl-carrier-protein] synthase II [Legionellales bacterium]|nr:beta-ketoacyl-[acyl-carrier-protein] synthase II [Legionellales bacterium]
MSKRRVVVTGLGMLSPLANNVEDSWRGIVEGKSGIRLIDSFDVAPFPSKISGSVRDFDPSPYMSPKEARKQDMFVQFAMAASVQAMEDGGLEVTDANADRIGLAVGSGIGGLPSIEKNYIALEKGGPRRLSPFFIPGAIINMAPGLVSIAKGMRGPTISIVTACTTGTHNIGHAARIIAYGDADVMLAGGSEMATCPLGLGGFSAMRALSTRNDDPAAASRPWDKDRDGFVLGDGAGVLMLEEYEHAKQRGAKIYAEVAGFGMSSDASHITSPHPEGLGACHSMQSALNDAGLNPSDVQYINAHGTSTPAGDELEALAVKRAFGEHAKDVAVSSTKSMTGHLLGAAGAVEAIFSILAIRDNVAPPTLNLDNPSDGCDLNFVPHEAQQRTIDVALSNSFGFGGTNGTLIFKRI